MRIGCTTIFAVASMIGWLAPNSAQPGIGLSAQADHDYYTRKRVNGVWITGKFRRTSSIKKAVQVASADTMDVTATNSIPVTLPVLPSMVGLAFPSSGSLSQLTGFPHDFDDAYREALRPGREQLARRLAQAQ